MDNIIASNICYGARSSNNWTDQLTNVSLAYSNSIVYLKFGFDESISCCDELKIKIKDESSSLHTEPEIFNVCISLFQYNEEYIKLYSNNDIYPSHDEIIYREYSTYVKNIENEYTIPTNKITNTGPGILYIMMIGTYDNEYSTSIDLKVDNTSIEGIIATRMITYDMNTGNGEPIKIIAIKGETVTLTDIIPEKDGNVITTTFEITGMDNYADSLGGSSITATKKEGIFYKFLGWSNESNATEPSYNSTDKLIVSNDIILYAVWEKYTDIKYQNNTLSELPIPSRDKIEVAYTVTLDPNNGDEITTHSIGSVTEYIFKGWVSSGQSTEIIDNDTEYYDNIIVYALWETIFTDNSSIYLPIVTTSNIITNSYVVTLDTNDGIISTEESDIVSKRITEYSFDCWSKSSSERDPVDLFYTPTEDITLYARYNSTSKVQSVKLPIATKDGYIFTGWNEEKDSGINVLNPYTPDKHITLYAHFISKNKLKMHIYHNGKWHHIIM